MLRLIKMWGFFDKANNDNNNNNHKKTAHAASLFWCQWWRILSSPSHSKLNKADFKREELKWGELCSVKLCHCDRRQSEQMESFHTSLIYLLLIVIIVGLPTPGMQMTSDMDLDGPWAPPALVLASHRPERKSEKRTCRLVVCHGYYWLCLSCLSPGSWVSPLSHGPAQGFFL